MTTTQMIINAIELLGLPIMIGAVYLFSRSFAQRLPEHQRMALEQFARLAVQRVEQQYTHNPSKKTLAEAAVVDLFESFRLPVPAKAAIEIAIEAAVLDLRKLPKVE